MKKIIKCEAGLTLVELLATIVLISLIGTLSYNILFQGYTNHQRISAESDLRDEADFIMATLIKDLFTAKKSDVVLSNSCSSNGYFTSTLTIKRKNSPNKIISFKESASNKGKGFITINDVPISFSNNVSLSLYPCNAPPSPATELINLKTADQLSYTLRYKLNVLKHNKQHSMEFENTFNLIND